MAPRTKRRQQPVKQDIFEILYCRDEVLTNAKGDFADQLKNEQLSTNHSQTSFKKKCFVAVLLIAVIIFILCIPKY